MALLAELPGLTDVVGDGRISDLTDVWWHVGGNVLIVFDPDLQLIKPL
jgi:hypothetical protein